jgi:hypothetical protein
MGELASQLGLAGAIIAATIILLREIRRASHTNGDRNARRSDTERPPSNGRVRALEDRTQSKMDRLEDKMQSQGVQLDCLSKEQVETRAVVERLNVQQERQGGKLDTILDIVRRR